MKTNLILIVFVVISFIAGFATCFICTIVNQDYSSNWIETYENPEKVLYDPETKEITIFTDGKKVIYK